MADDDIALDEKRVYGATREGTVAYVASDLGVTRVDVAGDQIGRFSLVYRGAATGVAAGDRLVVGTDEDVLVGAEAELRPTGFGPARAVSTHEGTPIAVAPDGEVGRFDGCWEIVGTVAGPRRLEADLLAAEGGAFRVGETLSALPSLPGALSDVAAGPHAATSAGLFRLESGWQRLAAGEATRVGAAPDCAGAVLDGDLFLRRQGEWRPVDPPTEAPIADIAAADRICAVTADGTVLVYVAGADAADGQGGWRSRALGVPGALELALA